MVPYVVAVTVMCVLLFVCMPRECEGDSNAGVGDGGGVVVVSTWHMGGICGSGLYQSCGNVGCVSVFGL